MEQIKIRECTVDDAEAIFEINKVEMGYEYELAKTREKLGELLSRSENKILVAVCNGEVVGYIHACDYDVIYSDHMKNIMGIAVLSSFKQKGIGKALLTEIEKWGEETGACGIRLVSGATRTGAHEFYRRCGYDGGKQQINFKKMFCDL